VTSGAKIPDMYMRGGDTAFTPSSLSSLCKRWFEWGASSIAMSYPDSETFRKAMRRVNHASNHPRIKRKEISSAADSRIKKKAISSSDSRIKKKAIFDHPYQTAKRIKYNNDCCNLKPSSSYIFKKNHSSFLKKTPSTPEKNHFTRKMHHSSSNEGFFSRVFFFTIGSKEGRKYGLRARTPGLSRKISSPEILALLIRCDYKRLVI
jgi:hypothetical protein